MQQEKRPVVLYGMGNGADKLLALCAYFGIRIAGVFASDEFVRGQTFHGFLVTTYREVHAVYPNAVVLVAFGTDRPAVLARIRAIAQVHTLYIPDLPLLEEAPADAAFFSAYTEEIRAARTLLADEASVALFDDLLSYKLTGEPQYLCRTTPLETVYAQLEMGSNEVFVDVGAYRGDTAAAFLRATDGCGRIVAIEPEKKAFRKLQQAGQDWSAVFYNVAAADRDGEMAFCMDVGRGSRMAAGGETVPCRRLDTIDDCKAATVLKLDVEGMERAVLLGATEILHRNRPKLLVSVYHRQADLFALPNLVHALCPDYRFFLRRLPCIPAWDTLLLAMPRSDKKKSRF